MGGLQRGRRPIPKLRKEFLNRREYHLEVDVRALLADDGQKVAARQVHICFRLRSRVCYRAKMLQFRGVHGSAVAS